MKITYYYDNIGTTCDRCGHEIKHVYIVESNGVTFKIGCDCIAKVSTISDYGLKELKKDIKSLEDTKTKYDYVLQPIEQLVKDNADNYGMIEMPEVEKRACNYEQTWRQRTEAEYIEWIEELRIIYPMRIEKQINDMNKKYKNVRLKA